MILSSCLFVLGAVLASCSPLVPENPPKPWQYEDLRALDPLDSAQNLPDLIALYHRTRGAEFQLRLDYFDLELFPDYDLWILLDTVAGGTSDLPIEAKTELQWDYLLQVPAEGTPQLLDAELQVIPRVAPRVVRDSLMDTVSIFFIPGNLTLDPDSLSLDVYLTPKNARTIADSIGPVRPSDPRPGRVPVLMAFWNTFPAYSPAQALRRWDGAHTGPFGIRHGLQHLVRNSARFSVPVMLLDLKNGPSLSALDYLGVLPEIAATQESRLLQLPDTIHVPVTAVAGELPFLPPPKVLDQYAAYSRELGERFGLPPSEVLFAPLLPTAPESMHRLIIQLSAPDPEDQLTAFKTRITGWNDINIAILPQQSLAQDLQTTADGLTPAIRRMLLEWALDSQIHAADEVVVLGGDLMNSAWGDPILSRAGLEYLGTHPWIQVLTQDDLLAIEPTGFGNPLPPPPAPDIPIFNTEGAPLFNGQGVNELQSLLLAELEATPSGLIKDLVWDSYYSLLAPNPPTRGKLPALRAGFLGQIGGLLAAARWAEAPGPLNDCDLDLDLDGRAECQLANDRLYLLLEPDGAQIALSLVMTPSGPYQWIGPQSQVIVGFRDPFDWDPTRGPAGDSGNIPGGFVDRSNRWAVYLPEQIPEGIGFENPETGATKSFRLSENQVVVAYTGVSEWPGPVQIPLLVAPEARFRPDWGTQYHQALGTEGVTWVWEGGVTVSATASTPMSFTPFDQSRDQLKNPEDPNFDYPPGHYLPFPLALLTLDPMENFTITLRVETER